MKNRKWIAIAFVVFNLIFFVPFWKGDLFNNVGFFASRKVNIPNEYFKIAETINSKKMDYVMYPMPFSTIGMGSFWWNGGKDGYAAIYPFIYMLEKKRIFFNDEGLLNNLSLMKSFRDGSYSRIFGLLNVGNIVFHWDSNWNSIDNSKIWYPNKYQDLNDYFKKFTVDNNVTSLNVGNLSLASLDSAPGFSNYFLPHFYTSKDCIISDRETDKLPDVLSYLDNNVTRPTIYFNNQNIGKEDLLNQLKGENNKSSEDLPTLEFKKINPTKYRVRVHAAKGEFPMIFSESFHDGWKAYIEPQQKSEISEGAGQDLNKYKILNGNEDDQATSDELKDYIQKGWVTDLGDGKERIIQHKKWVDGKETNGDTEKYSIDFVSKNFQGTVQNDNLPDGSIFETWFQEPIDGNANHLVANGYANSWVIDSDKLCAESKDCVKNPDGSYDFEMVVEFWPQRLFYVGLGVSSLTLIACLSYLGYDYYERKKSKGQAPE